MSLLPASFEVCDVVESVNAASSAEDLERFGHAVFSCFARRMQERKKEGTPLRIEVEMVRGNNDLMIEIRQPGGECICRGLITQEGASMLFQLWAP